MKRRGFFKAALALAGLKAIGVKIPGRGKWTTRPSWRKLDELEARELIHHRVLVSCWSNADVKIKELKHIQNEW